MCITLNGSILLLLYDTVNVNTVLLWQCYIVASHISLSPFLMEGHPGFSFQIVNNFLFHLSRNLLFRPVYYGLIISFLILILGLHNSLPYLFSSWVLVTEVWRQRQLADRERNRTHSPLSTLSQHTFPFAYNVFIEFYFEGER